MPDGYINPPAITDNSSFVVPSLYWVTSDNSGANQSTITVIFYARTTGTQNTFGTFTGGVSIDGVNIGIGPKSVTVPAGGATIEVGRGSHTVTHNSDGTRSVYLGLYGGIPGTSWTTTGGGGTVGLTDYYRGPSWADSSVASTATRGTAYSDGVSAYSASSYGIVSGQLPAGLSLNTSNGAITGTPTTVESRSFTIRAYGTYEGSVDTALSIAVNPALPVFSDSTVASSANVGVAYSDGVSASEAASYSVYSGTLPTGLSLNTSTGAITGTPTTPGTYTFVIRATNVTGSTNTGTLTITAISAARVWNGTAFVSGLANVWNGTAFVSGTIKVWDGTVWKNTN